MKKFVLTLGLLFITNAIYSSTWTSTYDSSGNSYGYDLVISRDSCYVVVGNIQNNIWLLKVNRNGVLIWEKEFGSSYIDEFGYSLDTTYDGGYIITGAIGGNNVNLIKTDSIGDTLWTRAFNNGGKGHCVRQAIDSGYIVEGFYSNGNMLLLKTDKNGDSVWGKNFNAYEMGKGGGICGTSDSNYIVVGTDSINSIYYLMILKINNAGDTLWSKHLTMGVFGQCIRKTLDNNYIIAAAYGTPTYLLKINSMGDTLWTKELPYFYFRSVYPTRDSGYILTGQKGILVKTDKTGTVEWVQTFPGVDNYSVKETCDSGYITVGTISEYAANNKVALYLMRADPTESVEEKSKIKTPSTTLRASQNPFINKTTLQYTIPISSKVSLKVYDISGREVRKLVDGIQKAGSYNLNLDGKELKAGVYFVKLTSGEQTVTSKVIVLK
ncbi:MAG: T9SS type A sorting domain-containing protein [bacterium]